MTDLKPYRPRNPSPWPRRLAIALAVALLIACMYVLSAQAAPIGPGVGPSCAAERRIVTAACVRPIGKFERRSCETARISFMLCARGQ